MERTSKDENEEKQGGRGKSLRLHSNTLSDAILVPLLSIQLFIKQMKQELEEWRRQLKTETRLQEASL